MPTKYPHNIKKIDSLKQILGAGHTQSMMVSKKSDENFRAETFLILKNEKHISN